MIRGLVIFLTAAVLVAIASTYAEQQNRVSTEWVPDASLQEPFASKTTDYAAAPAYRHVVSLSGISAAANITLARQ